MREKIPYPAKVTLYQCNCGIIFKRGKRKRIELEREIVTQKRQYIQAKCCDCGFRVKIVEPIDKEKDVEVHLSLQKPLSYNIPMYISLLFLFDKIY
jgi:hypothetical protein